MGRWYGSGKQKADELKQVTVFFLNRHGYFKTGQKSGTITWSRRDEETGSISVRSSVNDSEQYIKFIYTQTSRDTGEKKDFDYKIQLTTTPCYFGDKRYWFICPLYTNERYCGRRVGVLYLGDKYFGCRHCHNLTYESRNLSGISKIAGQVISEPELEELRESVKRKFYGGKMTRRHKRYLKKQEKNLFRLQIMARIFRKT